MSVLKILRFTNVNAVKHSSINVFVKAMSNFLIILTRFNALLMHFLLFLT